MKRTILKLIIALLPLSVAAQTGSLDDIRMALEASADTQTQEKVYVHIDNTCYFVGDTIWYKAYVARADNLGYTDISRMVYVELLTPDGLLVERQHIIVSSDGYGCGQFALTDSLYSGYYELRAYTRWMLNFNVSHKRYSKNDADLFYSRDMAADYFRTWDGLYSRVLPVFARPAKPGDYAYKQMVSRPKQHVVKAPKAGLEAGFYPEGGRMVEGVPCRVAFELTDRAGAAVSVSGRITDGDATVADAVAGYMGRGVFTVTPGAGRLKARFSSGGKEYTFDLPKAEPSGATVELSGGVLDIRSRNLPADCRYGVSVMCRGVLCHFSEVTFGADGCASVTLPADLPTGVNDVTLFDSRGRIVADRLFFVNNHDYDCGRMTVEGGGTRSYAPYEKVSIGMKCDGVAGPALFSVAVRDAATDDPTYDDGNIMTDMLLGSELKGFIANPAYYFASDDPARAEALDVLMMVQGWRRYKWTELADTACARRRYAPERSLTVEGAVYKMLSLNEVEPDEIKSWAYGLGMAGIKVDENVDASSSGGLDDVVGSDDGGLSSTNDGNNAQDVFVPETNIEYVRIGETDAANGVNHGGLKHEVMVEAEVSFSDGVVGATQLTRDGGRYVFEIPPFYGTAILNMKAYNEKDSAQKNMMSRLDKTVFREDAYPDFFVKRDMFFPIFTSKYSYYQTHTPEYTVHDDALGDSILSSLTDDDHRLDNLKVKGKRRGKRAIDYKKPAYVADAYSLYNDITDYGLSFGMYDMRQFPVQAARFLYGNMARYNRYNVAGRIDRFTYYRTFNPDRNIDAAVSGLTNVWTNRNARAYYNKLKLKSLHKIRVFTDYEPRNEDVPMVQESASPDVTVEMVPFADGGVQPVFRDRHIVLYGVNEPADFYNPDYSSRQPDAPADYRRTLYWNPNARTDADGRFMATFFNNGKETRIKVSVAGITDDGKFVY